MSHSPADGVAMVTAGKQTGRIVQIGSQRVSSQICAKAKELIAQGTLGELMLVEGWLGRNDPTGAWEYPPPPDLSPKNLDWDTWQGTVPKRPFDPFIFARWRCWKEYGTGVAGDLLVHLISGMMFMVGINAPPKQASAVGGIRRWKDGRNMPDVHAVVYDYDGLPVYMRLNLGTEMPEMYRIQGSKGLLEVTGSSLSFTPQTGGPTSTTCDHICGRSSRRCARGSRWWRTSCSVTMRRWPATWRMSRTFVRTLCLGTRPRRASRAEGRDRPSLT